MRENICFQCKKVCFGPINRLVQDACGHKKCRTCLLIDEERCAQCEAESCSENGFDKQDEVEGDVLQCDGYNEANNEVILNNHTAVIQVNGGCAKVKTDECNSIQVIEDESIKSSTECSLKALKEPAGKFKIKKPDKNEKKKHNPIDIPKHINIISDPLSYHCTICDKTFVTKTHVKYHSYCAGGKKK